MKPDNDRRGRRRSQASSLCQKRRPAAMAFVDLVAQHATGRTQGTAYKAAHWIYCYSRGGYNMSIPTDCARMRLWLWCGDPIVKPKMCPICVMWCGWGAHVCMCALCLCVRARERERGSVCLCARAVSFFGSGMVHGYVRSLSAWTTWTWTTAVRVVVCSERQYISNVRRYCAWRLISGHLGPSRGAPEEVHAALVTAASMQARLRYLTSCAGALCSSGSSYRATLPGRPALRGTWPSPT